MGKVFGTVFENFIISNISIMKRRDFIQSATSLAALGVMGGFGSSCGQTSGVQRKLGKTGFKVFPVGYGGIVSMSDGQDASDRYVSWAIDRGINYFDVAPSYGDAEEKLGNSLKAYRKDIYLACKTAKRLYKEAEPEFEQSFKQLHTDYFDVYQLHSMSTQADVDQAFGPTGVMDMMVKAKREGRVRNVGITAHSEEIALKAMAMYDFDTVLFPVNWMMNRLNGMGTALCKEAKRRGMGLLAMKSQIHRHWIDQSESRADYPKSWCKPIPAENKALGVAAIKFAFGLGADIIVPPGNFKSFSFAVDHIEEILNQPVSADESSLLDQEYALVKAYPFF